MKLSGHVTPQPHFNATDEHDEMSLKYLAKSTNFS